MNIIHYFAPVLAVQLGMIPYTAFMFNYISTLSFFCNLIIIFFVSAIVPIGMVALTFFILSGKTGFIGIILTNLTRFMVDINSLLSQNNLFSVDVVSPPLFLVLGIYIFSLFFASETFTLWKLRNKSKKILFSCLVFFVILFFVSSHFEIPFDNCNIVMVDVGQGDCIHIKTKSKDNIILDGGGKANYNVGKKIIKPYLLKNGVGHINLAMATHLHMDHYKGIKELEDTFRVKRIITRGKIGQYINLGNGEEIQILWPEGIDEDTDDENKNSMIFKVKIKGISILITGDISEEGEKMLLKRYRNTNILKSDILKVPHHGSRYSSSDAFIKAVSPKVAIIGVGKNNYGHPSNVVIEKYREKGIMIFRTDLHGAIGICIEKGKLKVCTNKVNEYI